MYKSPVHIVSDRFLDSVTADTLKMWRKEIMLRFKLTNESAITLNGKEYDKQAVTDTFAALNEDFDFHLKLFKNKPLLAFLESGDLGFFQDRSAQGIFADAVFQDKVYHLFSTAYGRVFKDAVVHPTDENIRRISVISNSPVAITSEASSAVFADAFGKFRRFIDDFAQLSRQSLKPSNTYQLKSEIADYVNPQTQKLVRALPPVFKDLKVDFARLLHNNLLVQTLGNGRSQNLAGFYNRSTLELLLIAAEIDRDVMKIPQVNQIIQLIKQAITRKKPDMSGEQLIHARNNIKKRPRQAADVKTEKSANKKGVESFMLFIIICCALAFFVSLMRNDDPNVYGYKSSEKESRFEKNQRERRNNASRRNSTRPDNSDSFHDKMRREELAEEQEKEFVDVSIDETIILTDNPAPKEAAPPPPKPAGPKIVQRKFKQSDLFGSWVISRLTDDGKKIKYKYNIINPTQGERVLTMSDGKKGIECIVKQPFVYKLTVDKWNIGRIYMTMKGVKPQSCTKVEADTLLRIAEREVGLPVGKFEKTIAFDYFIPNNRSVGLRLNESYYTPSSDIEDLELFANDQRKSQFMVGYVNNLLERNGVSVGRNPMSMRWYADKEAKYWMAKRGKKEHQIAEIILRNKKMYFKPVHFTPADTKVLPMFWLRNVYFIDKGGRRRQGDLRVTYHRKGDYFSVKTEVI